MKNIELKSRGLKCDNPKCDWNDLSIKVSEWKDWINAKCPKCNENVLTLEDYNNAMVCIKTAELINSLSIEELESLNQLENNRTLEDLKNLPMFQDTKGLENLKNGKRVLMSMNTHKKITVNEFKKIE